MRFMLLFKGDPSAETPPPADRVAEVVAAMREYGEDPARAGDLLRTTRALTGQWPILLWGGKITATDTADTYHGLG